MESVIDFSSNSGIMLYVLFSLVLTLIVFYFTFKMLENDGRKAKKKMGILVIIVLVVFCLVLSFSVTAFVLAFWTASFHRVSFGNATFSISMQDWGAYATCLSTIVSFITIYWVYKTYNSQVKISIQNNFDQLFTQLLNNHHIIYQKVINNKAGSTFYNMRRGLTKTHNKTIETVKNSYNEYFSLMDHSFCVNMRNYFKYIYYEISTVLKADIDEGVKNDYIRLIQSQMNHDELVCYLINQIQHKPDEEHKKHLRDLDRYNFFSDIAECSSLVDDNESKSIMELIIIFKEQLK